MAKQHDYSDEYDVFISYRRDGGQMMAVLLHDRLKAEGYRVFLDVESLRSGKFNKKLLTVIENCTDFVIILSPDSLDRCQNEGDWVRTEIVHAFKHDKNIIPVMLSGFKWPGSLPEDIKELRVQNGIKHNDIEYLDAAIRRLCDEFLYSEPQNGNTVRRKPGKQAKQKQPLHKKTNGLAIGAVSLVLVAALVFGGIMLWGNRDAADDPDVLGNGSLSNTQQPDADPSQSPDDLSNSPAAETPFQSAESTPPSANTHDGDFANANISEVIQFGGYSWLVLEEKEGKVLILSEIVIDDRLYHDEFEEITWEHSSLRHWLNDDYYNSFAAEDRARIAETLITNADNPWFGTPGGNDTTDRVFLLSLEEVVQYFGDSGQLADPSDDNKVSGWINDQYNSDRIATEAGGEASWWWLRSPGRYSKNAASVTWAGYVYVEGRSVTWTDVRIRPALWLNLQ